MRQEAPVLDSQTVVGVQARRHDGHDRRLLLALALLTSQGCTSGIEARDSLQGRVEALEAGLEALEVAGHVHSNEIAALEASDTAMQAALAGLQPAEAG